MYKFMQWCHQLDDESPGAGMLAFVMITTLVIVFVSVVLVGSAYKISGASDRYQEQKHICSQKGGELIYVKGTGNVCISGVINLK